MRRGAGGKRRDTTEAPIVAALRDLGCDVFYISGAGLPDVLVLAAGPTRRWTPLEIKSPKGRRTKLQQDLKWAVVTTPEQAIAAVLG